LERVKAAAEACSKLETKIPCLVDGINNEVNAAYAAWPDRLYVVGKDGNVAIAGGQGRTGLFPQLSKPRNGSWRTRSSRVMSALTIGT